MAEEDYVYGFAFFKTDGWERGEDFDKGRRYIRKVSKLEFDQHKPSGFNAEGTPYWNYIRVRRPASPGWKSVDD